MEKRHRKPNSKSKRRHFCFRSQVHFLRSNSFFQFRRRQRCPWHRSLKIVSVPVHLLERVPQKTNDSLESMISSSFAVSLSLSLRAPAPASYHPLYPSYSTESRDQSPLRESAIWLLWRVWSIVRVEVSLPSTLTGNRSTHAIRIRWTNIFLVELSKSDSGKTGSRIPRLESHHQRTMKNNWGEMKNIFRPTVGLTMYRKYMLHKLLWT